jgi:dihydroorotate dehydrogenase electron transfer subunit
MLGNAGPLRSGEARKRRAAYEKFKFEPAIVKKAVVESPNVKSFYLDLKTSSIPQPGQFMMIWVPGMEEIPMSCSGVDRNVIRISVAKKGPTTAELHKLKTGDTILARGPFGNRFSLYAGSYMLVGGGYGAGPLVYAAKLLSNLKKRGTYVVGAKTKNELLFVAEAKSFGMKTHVATDDGSDGHRGFVTELSEKLLEEGDFGSILTCGPERMIHSVLKQGLKRGIRVQASLERYMKCGFGICGSCVLDPVGLRVCVDGPIFEGASLLKTDFGMHKRDACGSRVEI